MRNQMIGPGGPGPTSKLHANPIHSSCAIRTCTGWAGVTLASLSPSAPMPRALTLLEGSDIHPHQSSHAKNSELKGGPRDRAGP